MISGTPSRAPGCLLMATTGTTSPSSARCRRSRRTSSPTSPVRVSSIKTRRTGGQAEDVLGRIVADLGIANLDAGGYAEVPETLSDLRVPHHPSADERHLAVELRRQVHEDLHPVDARRKCGDDQFAGGARED